MPKAIISNRIYLEQLPEDKRLWIKNNLTYTLEKNTFERLPSGKLNPKKVLEKLTNYKELPRGILTIPQGRVDLIPDNYEIIDKRITNIVPFPEPTLNLRKLQQEIYDDFNDSGFINAKPGFGKTFLAQHIAKKLEQKTLVITHTLNLRNQWISEAERLFNSEIGVIGSGKFDIENQFLVVGNIQSIVKYKTELAKEFGTLILDEAHHVPASTFSDIIDSSYARYRIGLSGTMQRKDGKHVLLTDFFSDNVYSPPVDNTINPTVNILTPGIYLDSEKAWAQKINSLLYDNDYQQFIAKLAKIQINKGHSILIIASRVEFLEKVKELIGETCMLVTGLSGGANDTERSRYRKQVEELINSGEKKAIAGSRQIFSEGISINALSGVILAEPMSFEGGLEQIIGRIMRKHDGKLQPEVFDINFSDRSSKNQNEKRLAFYINQGWEVVRY